MADNSAWIPLVKARVQDRVLAPLTREANELESSAAVDDAILQTAIDDAIGMFQLWAKLAPSSTNPVHIPIIVTGTMFYLLERKNPSQNEAQRNKFRYGCIDIVDSLTNTSESTNNTTASDPTRGGTREVLPDSDRSRFHNYLPGFNRRTSSDW